MPAPRGSKARAPLAIRIAGIGLGLAGGARSWGVRLVWVPSQDPTTAQAATERMHLEISGLAMAVSFASGRHLRLARLSAAALQKSA